MLKRKELPEFLRVPWGLSSVLVFVVAWVGGQLIIAAFLSYLTLEFTAVRDFISGMGELESAFALSLIADVLGVGIVMAYLKANKTGWRALGLRRPDSIPAAVGYILVFLIAVVFLAALASALIHLLVPSFNPDEAQVNEFTRGAVTNPGLAFVALVLIPPVFEEIIFRGFLFPAFAKYKYIGVVGGAIFSSILFGLAHFQANIVVFTFILGLFLCYLYTKTRSIIPGIVLHMINNFLAFLAITAK